MLPVAGLILTSTKISCRYSFRGAFQFEQISALRFKRSHRSKTERTPFQRKCHEEGFAPAHKLTHNPVVIFRERIAKTTSPSWSATWQACRLGSRKTKAATTSGCLLRCCLLLPQPIQQRRYHAASGVPSFRAR